ncbi:MAG: hypothetical protein SNJ64_05925 [Endomicrobiia bacterium]
MKIVIKITLVFLLGTQQSFCTLKYSTTNYILYPQVTNSGGGKKVSSNNSNLIQTIGQPLVGVNQTVNKKNILGFVSYFIKIILGKMSFYDEEPLSTVFQQTTNVVCKVTLESYSAVGLSTSTIKYRISNSGISENKFSPWRSGAEIDTIFSVKKVRFKISLPNNFNDTFSEGSNNYIQWYCEDKAHNKITSAKYRIKILENDEPQITILQPKNNDIVSINPVIEAKVTDERWGVNPSSITIKIENSNNEKVLELDSSKNPEIWDSDKEKIYYFSKNTVLTDGQRYTMTITVSDRNNKSSTKSVTFLAKSGQIADVIPYPSPFDPSKQPIVIRYVLAQESEVTINIYDQSGMLIKNLVETQTRSPGIQEDNWFGDNFAGLSLANGIYFCEIVVKNDMGQFRHYTSLAVFRR